jgi:hypothetical protein
MAAELEVSSVTAAMLEALVDFERRGLVECVGGRWSLTEAGRRSPMTTDTFERIEATRRDPFGEDSLALWGVRRAMANIRARR